VFDELVTVALTQFHWQPSELAQVPLQRLVWYVHTANDTLTKWRGK
jgi:hypothetical protein